MQMRDMGCVRLLFVSLMQMRDMGCVRLLFVLLVQMQGMSCVRLLFVLLVQMRDMRCVRLPEAVTSLLEEAGPNPENKNSAVSVMYQASGVVSVCVCVCVLRLYDTFAIHLRFCQTSGVRLTI